MRVQLMPIRLRHCTGNLAHLPPAKQGGAAADSDARVAALRRTLDSHPANFNAALELATTLHQLDHAAPNGGKRVPEAAAAYRRAAQLAASPAARAYVNSNLGALLLAGGRVGEAADAMHETLALARQLDMQRSDLVRCSLSFLFCSCNRADVQTCTCDPRAAAVAAAGPAAIAAPASLLRSLALLRLCPCLSCRTC